MTHSGLFAAVLLVFAGARAHAAERTMEDQVRAAMLKGDSFSFQPDWADHAGFARGLPVRVIEVGPDRAQDGLTHDFAVVLKDRKPVCVILRTLKKNSTEAHSFFYRASRKGKLQKVFSQDGRYANGKPIRGSGTIRDRQRTPKARAAFQHELDFWLKGLYRKPPYLPEPPETETF